MREAIKTKWHIVLIIIMMFFLSVMSWKISLHGISESVRDTGDIITSFDTGWTVYQRPNLCKADTLATYFVMGEIPSVQVILGDNRWLFFKSVTDGDSVADYEGTNTFSEEEKSDILADAKTVSDELEKRGAGFVILFIPNKEHIYSEYMPDTYSHCDKSRTDMLVEYLSENGVNAVSAKEELLKYHTDYELYYPHDTHWNQLGGYIGTAVALSGIGYDIPKFNDRTYTSSPLKDNYHYGADVDLARMAGVRTVFNDDLDYEIDGTVVPDWPEYGNTQNTTFVFHIHNDTANVQVSILLVGDSFRSAMIPSLSEEFADVYVVSRENYDSSMLGEINPDYVIAEYVERKAEEIKEIEKLIY
ncbi:MAG: hypothetical protein K6F90_05800 [Lachnospiraceae bacterium]|nr:hypothetical protein [Lachnospiraceae bacterium]